MPDHLRQALREARKNSGRSFRGFAQQAGYSESHLRSVENGLRAVTEDVVAAYERVLATGGEFASALARAGDAGIPPVPWDQSGALAALAGIASGSRVDRRTFIAASGPAMAALAARWRAALADSGALPPGTGSRQVGRELVSHIGERLGYLRHLDDEVGSGDLAVLARNELALIVRLLRGGRYTDAVGRRLYALAAEASRQAAWDYFDQDDHPAARRHFEAALRASATAGDPVTGAYALSFAAVQCYSTGEPQQAIALLETASDAVARTGTPKMTAMLAARSARAHSKAGSKRDCARQLYQARAALDRGPDPGDAPVLYWVTQGEIEMIAGSSALDLGDPAQAIRCFGAAITADYRGDDQYPRSHAIYLARAAEAHLRLHDLNAALDRAAHAVRCLGGVDSARSASAILSLRAKLAPHAASPAVREFLDATRPQP